MAARPGSSLGAKSGCMYLALGDSEFCCSATRLSRKPHTWTRYLGKSRRRTVGMAARRGSSLGDKSGCMYLALGDSEFCCALRRASAANHIHGRDFSSNGAGKPSAWLLGQGAAWELNLVACIWRSVTLNFAALRRASAANHIHGRDIWENRGGEPSAWLLGEGAAWEINLVACIWRSVTLNFAALCDAPQPQTTYMDEISAPMAQANRRHGCSAREQLGS